MSTLPATYPADPMEDFQVRQVAYAVEKILGGYCKQFTKSDMDYLLKNMHLDDKVATVAKALFEFEMAKALTRTFTKEVEVDRSITLKKALSNLPEHFINHISETEDTEGDTGKEKVLVEFFKIDNEKMSPNQLKIEYEKRGLVPDPCAQFEVNKKEPEFALDFPNFVEWSVNETFWWLSFQRYNSTFDVSISGFHSKERILLDKYCWIGGVRR